MDTIDELEWLVKGMRSASVTSFSDEVEQTLLDQLTDALKNCKASRANSTEARSKHHDWTGGGNNTHHDWTVGDGDEDLGAGRHHGYLSHLHLLPSVSTRPLLVFKVRTVLVPDLDWLNDTEGFEEEATPVARRKTPIPKSETSRKPETIQGASCNSPRTGAQLPRSSSEGHKQGRSWAKHAAGLARLLSFRRKAAQLPREVEEV
ncbi:hypothetical protein T484DRAFT_1772596 [Baffinella frigidus]|jgi:hypothetical protein|nr:hypothetical protein T484DRAFT_1772596 [Cryptophyta sp. CCMP2293]